ncbi:hypothetical protein SE17_03400 [Kouleothrix aurantiaca]|uniref:Uncharacterized protein n=1 Tax=Kouleothrix aurantiaca TaxID=186479 RepID=A0A0P9DG01_9CHLR|nr:hypothetical protein SE17_03400 [Kouleothrix aurantiaca]
MRAVVVEDGAGTVDDALVALDFCDDCALDVERREGDLKVFYKATRNTLQPASTCHLSNRVIPKNRMANTEVYPFR